MEKFKEQFEPEIILGPTEQGALAMMAASEGFKIFQRMMRSKVDQLIMSLINEVGDDDAKVLNKHKLAKAGALFFDGVIGDLNYEIGQYAASNVDTKPIDVTEGYIDIGPLASTQEDIEQDGFDGIEESPFA